MFESDDGQWLTGAWVVMGPVLVAEPGRAFLSALLAFSTFSSVQLHDERLQRLSSILYRTTRDDVENTPIYLTKTFNASQ